MAKTKPTTQPLGTDSDRRYDSGTASTQPVSIWGWKSIRRQVGSGVFACPGEGTERAYWVYQVRSWFTLFSIPVVPVKVLAEQVECFCCGNIYDPKVVGAGA